MHITFQDVCNRRGPVEAPRIWQTATPKAGHSVASFSYWYSAAPILHGDVEAGNTV